MEFFLSILIAVLVGVGIYCLLLPNLMRVILGILLLSNAVNMIIFVSSGIKERIVPIIHREELALDARAADPVPQALILTAIVIGFGVIAYFLVLCLTYFKDSNREDFHSGGHE